jgi:O-antigen ligase
MSLLSNRSPILVFISYASFSSVSSYNRVLIWEYGTAEVARHPLLGIGLGEWVRAPWMSNSMDNFWLIIAVRYGLPALAFLAIAILMIAFKSAAKKNATEEWEASRMAWIITIAGTAIAACTVHLWNNTFGLFMFVIGAGAWLIDHPKPAAFDHRPQFDDTPFEGETYGSHRYY